MRIWILTKEEPVSNLVLNQTTISVYEKQCGKIKEYSGSCSLWKHKILFAVYIRIACNQDGELNQALKTEATQAKIVEWSG